MALYHIISYHISYRFLNENGFGEGMDSCIPSIYAFELTDPTFITAFACTVTQLGTKKYNFLY